jgi:hypothetical protein
MKDVKDFSTKIDSCMLCTRVVVYICVCYIYTHRYVKGLKMEKYSHSWVLKSNNINVIFTDKI